MIAWRLVHVRALAITHHPLITRGATGRWNSEGVRVTYSSESVALAAMELLAYWNNYPQLMGYHLIRLDVPDELVEQLGPITFVQDHAQTRPYGDHWVREQRSAALLVPSAVLPFSHNVLLNQQHPSFGQVRHEDLGAFQYDHRIAGLIETAKHPPG